MNAHNRYHVLRESLSFAATSIAGPIAFFGGIGWLLDRNLHTKHIFLYSALVCAYISTHILMYRKLHTLQIQITSHKKKIGHDTEKIK